MMDLTRHKVFQIDFNKPDWVNKEGFKWWGIDIGDSQYGQAVLIESPDGSRIYAICDSRGVFYETSQLEMLAFHFDVLKAAARSESA